MPSDRTLSLADVETGVRATIAAYAHALDDGRVDDVLATFTDDAAVDIPGMGTHEGIEALRGAYGKWTPRRPQRHVVANTLVTSWDDAGAVATSDLVFLLKGDDGWSIQAVGRYQDTFVRIDDGWRFARRTATFQ